MDHLLVAVHFAVVLLIGSAARRRVSASLDFVPLRPQPLFGFFDAPPSATVDIVVSVALTIVTQPEPARELVGLAHPGTP